MKPKSHLQVVSPASQDERFSQATEETIEWVQRRIITLTNRNHWLWSEMVFYRSACRVLTWIVGVEVAVVIVALIWSLS